MSSLEITTGRLGLAGAVTVDTVPMLFAENPDLSAKEIQVNLGEVDDIDSSGLALLMYWHCQSEKQSGRLKFENCPAKLLDMAKLAGLEDVFR